MTRRRRLKARDRRALLQEAAALVGAYLFPIHRLDRATFLWRAVGSVPPVPAPVPALDSITLPHLDSLPTDSAGLVPDSTTAGRP